MDDQLNIPFDEEEKTSYDLNKDIYRKTLKEFPTYEDMLFNNKPAQQSKKKKDWFKLKKFNTNDINRNI